MKLKEGTRVVLVDRTAGSAPGRHGLAALQAALEGRGIATESAHTVPAAPAGPVVVAGRVDDACVRGLIAAAGVEIPAAAEALACARSGAALVLAGADDRGLAYALLEAADRVRTRGLDALAAMDGLAERPEHAVRSVCRFIMGKLDDEWYASPDFWRYWYGRLAAARFNRFTLIMGFDTGYLTPPYPFYVEVPEYPKVRAKGLSAADLHARLEHLRAIARMAHDHGIEFFLGTWQQNPWVSEEERLVDNLPKDDASLAGYCVAGLKALLRAAPELDGIHFRVNHEAGVGTQKSNEDFWRALVNAAGEVRKDIKLDLRAKGLTDDMIRDGLATGVRVTVPTKYWCEHAGLPHHLTQMRHEELTQLSNFNHSRRYSYADMLKRPRSYDTLYRLWNNGTTSVLLWGDPDYARRFSASCHLGDAAGFEISDPLGLRWGHTPLQKEAWRIHKDPKHAAGRWEDERYWMTYLTFGRLGYSTATSAEVWERELAARFPEGAAAAVLDAYASAGKILPLITAFHMPVHPQLSYWPEVSTGAALFEEHNHRPYKYMGKAMSYLTAEPSDPGLFYGVSEYVADAAAGKLRPKYTPLQAGEWLATLAANVRGALDRAAAARGIESAPEWPGTQLDFSDARRHRRVPQSQGEGGRRPRPAPGGRGPGAAGRGARRDAGRARRLAQALRARRRLPRQPRVPGRRAHRRQDGPLARLAAGARQGRGEARLHAARRGRRGAGGGCAPRVLRDVASLDAVRARDRQGRPRPGGAAARGSARCAAHAVDAVLQARQPARGRLPHGGDGARATAASRP